MSTEGEEGTRRAQWIAQHLPQLEHYAVPVRLYGRVYECVVQPEAAGLSLDDAVVVEAIDSPSSDQNAPRRPNQRAQRVLAKHATPAESQVYRVDHIWEFASVADAQVQLRQNAALRSSIASLVKQVIGDKNVASLPGIPEPGIDHVDDDLVVTAAELEGEAVQQQLAAKEEADVALVVVHLHLLAFSIRFGGQSADLVYYVLNTTGSSLREAQERTNLEVAPIFCMQQQQLFSIAWPTQDVAKGEELVRPYASKVSLMALCKKSYWEARFEGEDEFEWYCKYAHIRELLNSYVPKSDRVLIAGTGTSRLPVDMVLDGYSDVVAMDYASNVIAKMEARSESQSWSVRFVEADLTQMTGWETESVDCVVDKGCLDAMLLKLETDTTESTWKLVAPDSPDDLEDAKNSMYQVGRVLKPDGLLVFLTFGSPSNRIHMFDWVSERQCHHDVMPMQWEVLQCLEMSPTTAAKSFSTRFYVFVARKKVI